VFPYGKIPEYAITLQNPAGVARKIEIAARWWWSGGGETT